jgi:hypothetical protein
MTPRDASPPRAPSTSPRGPLKELCPRAFDDIERAELDRLSVAFDDVPTVVLEQRCRDIGISGAVYDASLALARFAIDRLEPLARARAASPPARASSEPLRIIELGAGVGACGAVVAAACESRGVPASLLLTDRNLDALRAAERNLRRAVDAGREAREHRSTAGESSGSVAHAVSRLVFGADAPDANPFGAPNVVLCADALYLPESAAPLARTVKRLLDGSGAPAADDEERSAKREGAPERPARCFLAWKPRASNPRKASAMRAFAEACDALGLVVRDADAAADSEGARRARGAAREARVADASASKPADPGGAKARGWEARRIDPAEGVRIFEITAGDAGWRDSSPRSVSSSEVL